MRQVRPGKRLRPAIRSSHKFRSDNERVPPVAVADQLGECRERSSALAGAQRSNQKCAVVLVQVGRGVLLIRTQAAKEGRAIAGAGNQPVYGGVGEVARRQLAAEPGFEAVETQEIAGRRTFAVGRHSRGGPYVVGHVVILPGPVVRRGVDGAISTG